ncbi:4-(cytidine 5'-diphospho)-2-C-methyl-D-erythritol kinase [Halovulum dunhuangense]|uniref:4-diphosphocytidyl-2-C-methyl-D-erythritol kinase n=1 Tax=Halovulum dunhuangense TaxID=1505036 RepID=A0A849KRY1_9RHOB|nr:4-(cytidine 5'-diphospho)-2-C-methyl-D-erythritol kinase [Halovulum dunhuangense]NNU79629.1 4-(cytidine 5'-diphospho)-2-C-methyl-D-erythritol kinase [Halovulum dunhuangense]
MRDVTLLAQAKVNLCLHVTGRRPDGYHMLDSLVVFPGIGDRLSIEPSSRLSLTIGGPFGLDLSADADNLVLRAAALMPGAAAAILLEKNLPVASGIGGGSADAAAALLGLHRALDLPLPDAGAVLALGADVPVCLAAQPTRMRGIGEVLEPVPALPPFWMVLANPGIACPTPLVFRRLEKVHNPGLGTLPDSFPDTAALFDWLAGTRNDLEAPAVALVPQIGVALKALAGQAGCRLARMSGSGATVFGLFETMAPALAAAAALRSAHPGWWVAAAPVKDEG